MIVLVASQNRGKVRELTQLLTGTRMDLKSPADIGIPMPCVDETGDSFIQNALLKARTLAGSSGHWALADDSGLEVDALGGAPGVNSARFAGPGSTDLQNIAKLLDKLRGEKRRAARFKCVLALVKPTGEELIAEGQLEGEISMRPAGEEGFGYDPVFLLPSLGKTLAQLPFKEKQALSHRARAAARLKVLIEKT